MDDPTKATARQAIEKLLRKPLAEGVYSPKGAEYVRTVLAYIARLEREQGEVVAEFTLLDGGACWAPTKWGNKVIADLTEAGESIIRAGVTYQIATIPEQSDE